MTTATATRRAEMPSVDSFIRYSDRTADGGYIAANGDYSFGMEDHRFPVRNARLEDIDFDRNGFALVKLETDVDFTDMDDVRARYHPQIEALIKDLTGAREVIVFLGILRGGDSVRGGGPALSAHVDFNKAAMLQWIGRLMPDRLDELKDRRLVSINVWRGVKPVENMPLAMCEAGSSEPGDFMTVRLGQSDEPVTKDTPGGLNMAFNPKHRWYYFPDMQPDEAIAFRMFDTANPMRAMTGHTAFIDPTSDPESPKRESFEIRTIAVLD